MPRAPAITESRRSNALQPSERKSPSGLATIRKTGRVSRRKTAVEDGIFASNPGLRLGRFLESHKAADAAQAMTREETQTFLEAASKFYPEFHF